jgi:hypothetical protein
LKKKDPAAELLMVCSIAGVWREARDPPAQAQSEKRKRGNFEKFGARSSQELGFSENARPNSRRSSMEFEEQRRSSGADPPAAGNKAS